MYVDACLYEQLFCLDWRLFCVVKMLQVCYEAGSQNTKLGPLYMNSLDNELIPMLHRQATNLQLDSPIIVELLFHILDE